MTTEHDPWQALADLAYAYDGAVSPTALIDLVKGAAIAFPHMSSDMVGSGRVSFERYAIGRFLATASMLIEALKVTDNVVPFPRLGPEIGGAS